MSSQYTSRWENIGADSKKASPVRSPCRLCRLSIVAYVRKIQLSLLSAPSGTSMGAYGGDCAAEIAQHAWAFGSTRQTWASTTRGCFSRPMT